MKTFGTTILLCFLYLISATAQEADKKEKKKSPIRYAHKIQPAQLFVGNIKYAFEFSLTKKKSLEIEGSFGPGFRRISERLIGEGIRDEFYSAYFLTRYKVYTRARKNRRLNGFYVAPTMVVGLRDDSYTFPGTTYNWGYSNPYVAGTLDMGYQTRMGIIVVDLFCGFGFSFSGYRENGDFFSHYSIGHSSWRVGLRTGFVHR